MTYRHHEDSFAKDLLLIALLGFFVSFMYIVVRWGDARSEYLRQQREQQQEEFTDHE